MAYSRMQIWILAIRPKTLWAAVAPVLIGSALAYDDDSFSFIPALLALIGSVLIQIGTNFANDYYDYKKGADNGERMGPVRVTQAGLVKPKTMKRAAMFVFSLAILSGIYLVVAGGWPILLIGLMSVLFGYLYTAGPWPLSYNGLADIFVLIFFGPVAVGGTYYVQTLSINSTVLIAGLAPGLFSTAILTVNNLRDADTDKKSGKRTLAVRLGKRWSRWQYFICILTAAVIPMIIYYYTKQHPMSVLSAFIMLPALPALKTVFSGTDGKILNSVLATTGKLLILYSIIFSITWVL